MAFKMKGSPMKRNFSIGTSPVKQKQENPEDPGYLDPSEGGSKDYLKTEWKTAGGQSVGWASDITFDEKFAAAKKHGLKEFTWKGKKYNTKTK